MPEQYLDRAFADIVIAIVAGLAGMAAAWLGARRGEPEPPFRVDAGPGLVRVTEQLQQITADLRQQKMDLERARTMGERLGERVYATERDTLRQEERLQDIASQLHDIKHTLRNMDQRNQAVDRLHARDRKQDRRDP